MSSEDSLWSWLRGRLPQAAHVTRIESEVGSGIPDVYFKLSGVKATWLELKHLRKKKLPFGDDGLRPAQIRWILDEVEQGGEVYIVANVRETVYFLPGHIAEKFNEYHEIMFKHWAVLQTKKRDPKSLKLIREFLACYGRESSSC